MRSFATFAVAALALSVTGLAWWLLRGAGAERSAPAPPLSGPELQTERQGPAVPTQDEPDAATAEEPPRYEAPRQPPLLPPAAGAPVTLAGDVFVEAPDGTLRTHPSGSFRLDVFAGGETTTREVQVELGQFTTLVPSRSTLWIVDGVLEGQPTHFAKPAGPFEPRPDRLALVGRAVPTNRLRVLAAGTGADLVGVTVREAEGPGGGAEATDGGPGAAPDAGRVFVTDAASPVLLPWIPSVRPLWIEVAVPGYAPARVLLDPRRANERTLELSPCAGRLTVHVTGPGRGRVEGLVVQRVESAERQPIAAHLRRAPANPPPDPVVFEVDGLAAAQHIVRATLLDRATLGGVVRDLARGEITLQVAADARLDLYVPAP
ncbi:MAG: hypothetical protein R3F49_18550 [Planctomycetota bacterium]